MRNEAELAADDTLAGVTPSAADVDPAAATHVWAALPVHQKVAALFVAAVTPRKALELLSKLVAAVPAAAVTLRHQPSASHQLKRSPTSC